MQIHFTVFCPIYKRTLHPRGRGKLKDIIRQEANEEYLTTCGEIKSIKACGILAHRKCIPRLHLSWRRACVARSAVVLGGCVKSEIWNEVAYAYGRNAGIAFQLVEDVLDYKSALATLGKPGNADLRLGQATAPALGRRKGQHSPSFYFPIHSLHPSTAPVSTLFPHHLTRALLQARNLVHQSSAISRTKQPAEAYAYKAKNMLQDLPHSEARDVLDVVAERVVGRKN
ncbi:hypothetical protein D9756_010010 [Leucocoprinus leucothites]|uniref:Uncharacterized protein n=1 Tax=Leucocoprinus leucothites TaxID=201217 RepID=A0A8H5CT12_9AGAR|nr:hypothetical protein D9756_010010 [Leucoagaricus leucothites]